MGCRVRLVLCPVERPMSHPIEEEFPSGVCSHVMLLNQHSLANKLSNIT